jgi:hypothetical protein
MWFQKHAVPHVDETYVETIERDEGSFVMTLAASLQYLDAVRVRSNAARWD